VVNSLSFYFDNMVISESITKIFSVRKMIKLGDFWWFRKWFYPQSTILFKKIGFVCVNNCMAHLKKNSFFLCYLYSRKSACNIVKWHQCSLLFLLNDGWRGTCCCILYCNKGNGCLQCTNGYVTLFLNKLHYLLCTCFLSMFISNKFPDLFYLSHISILTVP
jgi:hypothetical protein